MHVDLHVECPLLLPDFNQDLNTLVQLVKLHNIKFHENLFSSSWVVMNTPHEWTNKHGKGNMPIFANFLVVSVP
jgi:hypothetical protein